MSNADDDYKTYFNLQKKVIACNVALYTSYSFMLRKLHTPHGVKMCYLKYQYIDYFSDVVSITWTA